MKPTLFQVNFVVTQADGARAGSYTQLRRAMPRAVPAVRALARSYGVPVSSVRLCSIATVRL